MRHRFNESYALPVGRSACLVIIEMVAIYSASYVSVIILVPEALVYAAGFW